MGKVKHSRRATGTTGFYRVYPAGAYRTIQEAVKATIEAAESFGYEGLRVNRQQTGKTPNGAFFVALKS